MSNAHTAFEVGKTLQARMTPSGGKSRQFQFRVTKVSGDAVFGMEVTKTGELKIHEKKNDDGVTVETQFMVLGRKSDFSSVKVLRMNLFYGELEVDPTGTGEMVR